ncbi:MAG: aminoglycoside phosphotransferase family protein [Chloroflexi bacterium]|nr:aminoglycoside phosphotransferase family protein [Chloroflexota bacterium]
MDQLSGGNSNTVYRDGDTVVRQTGPWSPFVHSLLHHLASRGFAESPRVLAVNDNTETLTYLHGTVGHAPLDADMQSDDALLGAAQLLRRLHDQTADFVVPDDAQFMLPLAPGNRHEVICHNDFAPYNCVFQGARIVGILDFDTAAPGRRIWDVAYAVYRFVPLMTDAACLDQGWTSVPDREARLRLFRLGYGSAHWAELIETVTARIAALTAYMQATGQNLDHLPGYEADLDYIRMHRSGLERALE